MPSRNCRSRGRLLLVDLRQGEADVDQHPLARYRRIVGEQADVDHPPNPAHVHLGQVGLLGVKLGTHCVVCMDGARLLGICTDAPIQHARCDKRRLMLRILLTITILGYCAGARVASAGDVVSEGGTAEDIQKAAEIARPGDSIIVPKGKFPFHGQVFLPDGVSVRGAGKNDTLLIKDDRLSEWKPMFSVDCKTGKPFSFSGITIQGAGRELQASTVSSDHIQDQGLVLRGKCRDFRIFGNRFTKFSRAGIELNGDNGSILGEPFGVIFENEFIDNWSPGLGYGVAVNGSATAWSQPLALGTGQAVFVEDNYFEANRCAIQANNGARYVFRHNQISNNRENSAPIYSHGKGPWPRGTRSFEIYE